MINNVGEIKKYLGKTFEINQGLFTPTHFSLHPDDRGKVIGKLVLHNQKPRSFLAPIESLKKEYKK